MQLSTQVFEYDSFAVRDDLPQAYREIWERISKPGNWWNAADRIAIAEETRAARQCPLCKERQSALSPFSVKGDHHCTTNLPGTAIDAVHRLTTDPARLTEKWLNDNVGLGLSHEKYIELLGIVVAVISIDGFHRALGLPLEPLPTPNPGEPNRRRPKTSREIGAWVATMPPKLADAEDADLYDGKTTAANVIQAMSLVPDSVRMLKTLSNVQYLPGNDVANPAKNGNRKISRAQMEMLAGRVSSLSGCFY